MLYRRFVSCISRFYGAGVHANLRKYFGILLACASIGCLEFYVNTKATKNVDSKLLFVSKKQVFKVLDWTASERTYPGFFPIPDKIINCGKDVELHFTMNRSELDEADIVSFHLLHMRPNATGILRRNPGRSRSQYSLLYNCESDANSKYRQELNEMNFVMSYNLYYSFPYPITYFRDITQYLKWLLEPQIPFIKKNEVPVVWIARNCKALNGRTYIIEMLMKYIPIDSFGSCLNTREGAPDRGKLLQNYEIYRNYKFVISIENTNCNDYVTEKLILAYAGGAIPIIASYNNTPNYLKFVPNNSFINVYDFRSIKELAAYINKLASNETLYNEYMKFRLSENNTIDINRLSKKSLIDLLKQRVGEQLMFEHIVKRETEESLFCKVANFLHNHPNEIPVPPWKKYPTRKELCLPNYHLSNTFRQ